MAGRKPTQDETVEEETPPPSLLKKSTGQRFLILAAAVLGVSGIALGGFSLMQVMGLAETSTAQDTAIARLADEINTINANIAKLQAEQAEFLQHNTAINQTEIDLLVQNHITALEEKLRQQLTVQNNAIIELTRRVNDLQIVKTDAPPVDVDADADAPIVGTDTDAPIVGTNAGTTSAKPPVKSIAPPPNHQQSSGHQQSPAIQKSWWQRLMEAFTITRLDEGS
jgi:hypothetical protein